MTKVNGLEDRKIDLNLKEVAIGMTALMHYSNDLLESTEQFLKDIENQKYVEADRLKEFSHGVISLKVATETLGKLVKVLPEREGAQELLDIIEKNTEHANYMNSELERLIHDILAMPHERN
jgi:hypothetical protein